MAQWKTLEGIQIENLQDEIRSANQIALDNNGMIFAYIGTDGQNLGKRGTSFVQCVALHIFDDCAIGKGGRVFYIRHMERFYENRPQRLLREAEISINLTQSLEPLFTELDIPFEVHIDVNSVPGENNKNKSYEIHDAAKGWVESMGWECKTKPYAWLASIVCDKHTRGMKPKKNRPFGKHKK